MIGFVDSTLSPFLGLIVGWSIRWGVLILALAVWFRVRPPRLAATRHLLCLTVLVAGFVLPVAPRWSVPGPWASVFPTSVRPQLRRVEMVRTEVPIDGPARPNLTRPEQEGRFRPESARDLKSAEDLGARRWAWLALGVVWLAGTILVLARLAVGQIVLTRLRALARPFPAVAFERARQESVGGRGVVLASHPAVGSPIVLGGRSPMILVPVVWNEISEVSQRACLLHEMAHLGRRDDLWKFVAELARAPFWFHPAVAWLLARLDREAELACDEVAVSRGVGPRELAELLLAYAREPRRLDPRGFLIGRTALPFFEQSTVLIRIQRLLEDDMSRTMIPVSKTVSFSLVATFAALALAIGGAGSRAIEPATQRPAPGSPPAAARSFVVAVKDGEGRPVEGASVVAMTFVAGDSIRDVAQTDAKGLARFDREPQPSMSIRATRKGYGFATLPNVAPDQLTSPIVITLPRARSLPGSVVDKQGRPIAGAEIQIESTFAVFPIIPADSLLETEHGYHLGESSITLDDAPLQKIRTDRDGKLTLDGVPLGRDLMLRATAEGYATHRFLATDLNKPVDVVLAPEARVVGRVVSEVPGVSPGDLRIEIYSRIGGPENPSDSAMDSAMTDASGRFEARGLKAGRAMISVSGVQSDAPWTFVPATNILLKPGSVSEVTITIIPGVVVEGRLVSADGVPVPNAVVDGSRFRGPRLFEIPVASMTDATGQFRFRLAAGDEFEYYASPFLDSIPGRTVTINPMDQSLVTIPQGVTRFTLPTKRLARPTPSIGGQTKDSSGVAPARMTVNSFSVKVN